MHVRTLLCTVVAALSVAATARADDGRLTYGEADATSDRLAAGLADLGVTRGDRALVMMGNRIAFYPLDVAAQHVGATSFSVYNTLPAEQLAYVFDNAGTKVVICEQQYVEHIRRSGARIEHIIAIDGAPHGTLPYEDFLAGGSEDFDFE